MQSCCSGTGPRIASTEKTGVRGADGVAAVCSVNVIFGWGGTTNVPEPLMPIPTVLGNSAARLGATIMATTPIMINDLILPSGQVSPEER